MRGRAYVLIRFSSGSDTDIRRIVDGIKETFKMLFGEVGLIHSQIRVARRLNNGLILAVKSDYLKELVTAVVLSSQFEKAGTVMHVVRISRTLKRSLESV